MLYCEFNEILTTGPHAPKVAQDEKEEHFRTDFHTKKDKAVKSETVEREI